MGIFMGGYQLHNMAIPIIRDSKDPSKNSRDVFIGYILAFVIYLSCGILGYLGFSGSYFKGKPLTEDALNMFPQNNILTTLIRFFTFLHISTSMCLIFAMERSMIFLVLYKKVEMTSYKINMITNACILVPAFIFSVSYPHIGKLTGILASLLGLAVIYILPSMVHLKVKYLEWKNPTLAYGVNKNMYEVFTSKDQDYVTSPKIAVEDGTRAEAKLHAKPIGTRSKEFKIACVIAAAIFLYGLAIAALQYVNFPKPKWMQ